MKLQTDTKDRVMHIEIKGKDAVVLQWSISLSQAIEPRGGYTTESVTHGQCDAFPAMEYHRPLAGTNYTAW